MQLAVQCQINNGGHLQLRSSLFCTAQSAFAVEICAQMGQIAGMAWKNSSGTSLLLERLQQILSNEFESNLSLFFVAPRHPGLFATTRWGTFIASVLPQDWCMTMLKINRDDVARINNEKGQIYHKPGSPWENWWLPTTLQPHFFCLHKLYI